MSTGVPSLAVISGAIIAFAGCYCHAAKCRCASRMAGPAPAFRDARAGECRRLAGSPRRGLQGIVEARCVYVGGQDRRLQAGLWHKPTGGGHDDARSRQHTPPAVDAPCNSPSRLATCPLRLKVPNDARGGDCASLSLQGGARWIRIGNCQSLWQCGL